MKTLIAMPCMDMVHTLFLTSLLKLQVTGTVEFSVTTSSLIYDARNALAKKAVEEEFDRILWLDSDMTFEGDVFNRLSKRLDEGYPFVSGLYFKRRLPIGPVIYKACGSSEKDGQIVPFAEDYFDYPKEIFEIAACGFGCCMMTTDMIKAVATEFGLPFSPILGFGEDLSFCCKAKKLGYSLYCDPEIKFGHLGYKVFDENDFVLKGVKQWNV